MVRVFDMNTIEFSSSRGIVVVLHAGKPIFCCEANGTKSDMASFALNRFLDTNIEEDGTKLQVGLYHPGTFEVAIGAVPSTVAYGDSVAVEIGADGIDGFISGADLHIGRRRLGRRVPDFERVRAAASA